MRDCHVCPGFHNKANTLLCYSKTPLRSQASWLTKAILAYVQENMQNFPVAAYKIGQDFGCSDLAESALRVVASVDGHVISLLTDCSSPSEDDQLLLMELLIGGRSLKQVCTSCWLK